MLFELILAIHLGQALIFLLEKCSKLMCASFAQEPLFTTGKNAKSVIFSLNNFKNLRI